MNNIYWYLVRFVNTDKTGHTRIVKTEMKNLPTKKAVAHMLAGEIDDYTEEEIEKNISMVCPMHGLRTNDEATVRVISPYGIYYKLAKHFVLRSGMIFKASDSLGEKYLYKLEGIQMKDSTGCSYIKLYNITNGEETNVEYAWFKEREITVYHHLCK